MTRNVIFLVACVLIAGTQLVHSQSEFLPAGVGGNMFRVFYHDVDTAGAGAVGYSHSFGGRWDLGGTFAIYDRETAGVSNTGVVTAFVSYEPAKQETFPVTIAIDYIADFVIHLYENNPPEVVQDRNLRLRTLRAFRISSGLYLQPSVASAVHENAIFKIPEAIGDGQTDIQAGLSLFHRRSGLSTWVLQSNVMRYENRTSISFGIGYLFASDGR